MYSFCPTKYSSWRWACPAFQCVGNDGHRGWVYQASQCAIFLHSGAWIKRPLCIIQMNAMVQRDNSLFKQIFCLDTCFLVTWGADTLLNGSCIMPQFQPDLNCSWTKCAYSRLTFLCFMWHILLFQNLCDNGVLEFLLVTYRGANKSLARPGRKQATATEYFDVHISYL